MTLQEDIGANITARNKSIGAIMDEKDATTLDLAKSLDQQNELNSRNAQIITDLTLARNEAVQRYDTHMATVHPVVTPTPVPIKRRTLHGLGGGNTVRTGIEIDRRYYAAGDKDKTVKDTTANEAKGIISVNSHKMPYTWDRMAKGDGDTWFKELMTALREAVKPKIDDPDDVDEVWESVHHEPEGDQPDERMWRDTQERLSLLVPDDDVLKFWLTTTGWNQELNTAAAAARVDWENLWPKNGKIYGIAYDAPYNTFGKIYDQSTGKLTGENNLKHTDPNLYIDAVATRAKQFGVEAASFEWAYSDEQFAFDNGVFRDKVMDRAITNPIQQLLAEIYFDTPLNSSHTWLLGAATSAKRKGHMAAMAARKGK